MNRINTDLANDFGNLLSRTTSMINKFSGGRIPAPGHEEPLDREIRELALSIPGQVDKALDVFDFSQALQSIGKLVNRSNKYIEETSPWALARDEKTRSRMGTVLYTLAESLRFATVLVSPFMPTVPEKVFAQLGIPGRRELLTWESVLSWGGLQPGTRIQRGEPIFPRIDWEKETEKDTVEEKKKEESLPGVAQIDIEDFGEVDLRVAEVIQGQKVEGADKLLELRLRLGEEERTIVAGIAQHYTGEEMIGKKIIIVANLKPAKVRGIVSQGMLLAASQGKKLAVLTVDGDVPSGARVK